MKIYRMLLILFTAAVAAICCDPPLIRRCQFIYTFIEKHASAVARHKYSKFIHQNKYCTTNTAPVPMSVIRKTERCSHAVFLWLQLATNKARRATTQKSISIDRQVKRVICHLFVALATHTQKSRESTDFPQK